MSVPLGGMLRPQWHLHLGGIIQSWVDDAQVGHWWLPTSLEGRLMALGVNGAESRER